MKRAAQTPLLALAMLMSACAGTGGSPRDTAPAAIVIDVRTPAEFIEKHLVGARNLDFRDAGFGEAVRQLDRSRRYLLYCRTGNRSAQAAELMKSFGFTDVQSIGGLQQAAATLHGKCTPIEEC